MRIASWNVNGARAIAKKGFARWLEGSGADVMALQETRCTPEQAPASLLPGASGRAPAAGRWHTRFISAERKGYSGVAILSRAPFLEHRSSLGDPALDREGRVLLSRIGALTVVSAYFPNGNGKDRDNGRVRYKLRFSRRLFEVLAPRVEAGEPVVVLGDFNTAPRPIDLARPKQNRRTSGFLTSERAELRRWLKAGWVDTFRRFEPGAGHYTWWSQRFGVRERNVGWRIDLALASPAAAPYLSGAAIHAEVRGSDHCPISVDLDDAVRTHGRR